MSPKTLRRLLERYGQTVEVHPADRSEAVKAKAFLQPMREKQAELQPTAVGLRRQDRFRYLGLPELPLYPGKGTWVRWNGRSYEVETAQAIYVGDEVSHWWAVLRPGKEDA